MTKFIKSSKSLGFSIVGMIIVIAAVAVLGGYWYWQTGSKMPSEISPGTKGEIDTSTLAPSEIEGWKTYRNEKYGFEVRYPMEYLLSETDIVNDVNKKIGDLKTFQLRADQCKIFLFFAGGKGFSKEWIYEDASLSLDGKDFSARKFFYLDKTHLRWISIYNFPTPQYELQLQAGEGIDRDISSACSDTFYSILSTLKWIK